MSQHATIRRTRQLQREGLHRQWGRDGTCAVGLASSLAAPWLGDGQNADDEAIRRALPAEDEAIIGQLMELHEGKVPETAVDLCKGDRLGLKPGTAGMCMCIMSVDLLPQLPHVPSGVNTLVSGRRGVGRALNLAATLCTSLMTTGQAPASE